MTVVRLQNIMIAILFVCVMGMALIIYDDIDELEDLRKSYDQCVKNGGKL